MTPLKQVERRIAREATWLESYCPLMDDSMDSFFKVEVLTILGIECTLLLGNCHIIHSYHLITPPHVAQISSYDLTYHPPFQYL